MVPEPSRTHTNVGTEEELIWLATAPDEAYEKHGADIDEAWLSRGLCEGS